MRKATSLAVVLALGGCGGGGTAGRPVTGPNPPPTTTVAAPSPTPTPQPSPAAVTNRVPEADITVEPTSGLVPLAVAARMCGSRDADGDLLRFTVEWGDGARDGGRGASCRFDHTFGSMGSYTVRACVTDDLPGHDVCRNTTVNVTGATVRILSFDAGCMVDATAEATTGNFVGTAALTVDFELFANGSLVVRKAGTSAGGNRWRFTHSVTAQNPRPTMRIRAIARDGGRDLGSAQNDRPSTCG